MNVPPNTFKVLRNVPLPDEASVMHTSAAVLDMGSHTTRLGFAGDNAPRMCERTVYVRGGASFGAAAASDSEAGATMARSIYTDGVISDWGGYEQLLHRVVNILNVSDADHPTPLLLTEKALVPSTQRQKIAELLFETHGVASASFCQSPALALYASGLCTGVSVELGHHQSHVVSVFQGFSLFHATHCLGFGGSDLTDLFTEQLRPSPSSSGALPFLASLSHPRQRDLWEYLKERFCLVAESKNAFGTVGRTSSGSAATADLEDRGIETHTLPDGTTMYISSSAQFSGPEVFFQPHLSSKLGAQPDQSSVEDEVLLRTTNRLRALPELIIDCMKRCDQDLMPYLADHILLSGGSSLFRNLPQRLETEVQGLLPPAAEGARVLANVERRDAAFIGGSIWASLPAAQNLWVTKADYDEVGSMAVVRGCP